MSNDHGLPGAVQEQRTRDGDLHVAEIDSGGTPAVPTTSLTLDAFATNGYVTSGDELIFVGQPAVAVTLAAVDGLHWLALHEDMFTLPAGWTRPTFGSHYLLQQLATQPPDPAGGMVFSRVTVASSVITATAPVGRLYARLSEFGGVGDDATLNDQAFADAIAHVGQRGVLIVDGTSDDIYRISTAIVLPPRSVAAAGAPFAMIGEQILGPQIKQMTSGQNVISASGESLAVQTLYRSFRHLYLNGNSNAPLGIDLAFNVHFEVASCFIQSCTTAALNLRTAISYYIGECKLHNNLGDAIRSIDPGDSSNTNNAGSIVNNSLLNNGGWGINAIQLTSVTVTGNTIENNTLGGIHTDLACGGAIQSSNHFESNTAADIDVGSVAFGAEGLTIEGNFYGGNFDVTSYVPIKIHRSTSGVTIRRNFLNTGNRFVDANAAGTITSAGIIIADNAFNLANIPTPVLSEMYQNLRTDWVSQGNSLVHEQAVFQVTDSGNFVIGDFPYAGYIPTLPGTTTWAKTLDTFHGRRICGDLIRPTGQGTPFLTFTPTIGPTNDGQIRGKFATFEVWAKNDGADALTMTITISTASPLSFTIAATSIWKAFYVTHLIPATDVSIITRIALDSDDDTLSLAAPRLYMGATRPWDGGHDNGAPYWRNVAAGAPTTGTWDAGDIVWENTPAGATPTVLHVNTLGGTPGTFVALVAN